MYSGMTNAGTLGCKSCSAAFVRTSEPKDLACSRRKSREKVSTAQRFIGWNH